MVIIKSCGIKIPVEESAKRVKKHKKTLDGVFFKFSHAVWTRTSYRLKE